MAMRPPPLVDDLMREIFQRLPPHDPRDLVRAAAVCRSWRGIISDADFAREYREFHGAPPMLGFLFEELHYGRRPYDEAHCVSHFVSTATFRPPPPACQDRPYWQELDSRHGLVLFYTPRMRTEFLVCDLVTSHQWRIHASPKCGDIMWWEWDEEDKKLERIRCNAAVFCAKDRCDHLDCHGGPFRIALVGSVIDGNTARAAVYSSETREWSDMIEVQTLYFIVGPWSGHSALVGNKVYVPCVESDSIVEYNMDEQKLSVIDAPDTNHGEYIHLMGVENNMLLFASVVTPRLYLSSMEIGPSGAVGWARQRIIELEPLVPCDVLSDKAMLVVGFAEGINIIFLSTIYHGLHTIDLNSGEHKKVHERIYGYYFEKVMPYMSFYTGAWGRLPTSHQASRAVVGATTI
ncbi:uncharacterized protein LOC124697203 [Lolium rigidum]|uniref:uncharacterized protein LOC124697203 n=1 Tax=Lolium rigidum TaxID=89674 RepID=UPI001F5DE09B|nr:uncharacterized protein LOC124697203 [Lolium rigidum]